MINTDLKFQLIVFFRALIVNKKKGRFVSITMLGVDLRSGVDEGSGIMTKGATQAIVVRMS
jgi:hypothetical protein